MTSGYNRPLKILYGMPPGIVGDPAEDMPTGAPVEWANRDDLTDEQFAARAHEFDAIVGLTGSVVKNEIIEKTINLRAVLSFTVGYENIDRSLIPRGCDYAITLEHEYGIADWAMMAVLMLNRDVMKMDREFRSGSIRTAEENGGPHPDLFGSTLAVVGLGRIGKRVVQLARAHDMQCIAATRTVPDADTRMALGLESVRPLTELNDVLAEADHVVITIPSAPETVGMISAEQLKAMKTTAFLINVARGNILDESATYEALKSGSIAGAALDVWWQNDISDEDADLSEPGITRWSKEPFWELENVIMSPHWSSFTTGMIGRKFAEMSRQIERQYNGEPLKNSIPELSRVNEV